MNLSEAALNARRVNAQKSTGPRTEEGKARSRQNAFKHGLAGKGVVLNEEDAAEVAHRAGAWAADLAPRGAAERWLVEQAALASVRIERCQRGEFATLNRRRREAVRSWDEQREQEVEDLARRFVTEPDFVWRALRRTSEGCQWLIAAWSDLAAALETPGHWSNSRCFHAFRLLGLTGVPPYVPGEPFAELALAALVLMPEAGPPQVAHYLLGPGALDLAPETLAEALRDRLPDQATSRDRLRAIVAAEIAGLEERRDVLRENFDLPDRIEAPDRALNDPSHEAELSRRYEATHTANLHRCLHRLALGRKQDLWLGIDAEPFATIQEETLALSVGETVEPGGNVQNGQTIPDQENWNFLATAKQDVCQVAGKSDGDRAEARQDRALGDPLVCQAEEEPWDSPTRPPHVHPLPEEGKDFWPLLPLGEPWDPGQPGTARGTLPAIGAAGGPSPSRNEPKSGDGGLSQQDAREWVRRDAGEIGAPSKAPASDSLPDSLQNPREGKIQDDLTVAHHANCGSVGASPSRAELEGDLDMISGCRAAVPATEHGPGGAGDGSGAAGTAARQQEKSARGDSMAEGSPSQANAERGPSPDVAGSGQAGSQEPPSEGGGQAVSPSGER